MSTIQPLANFTTSQQKNISKKEQIIFEAEILTRICEELKERMKEQNKDYFQLMKFNMEKENTMIEANFIRGILNDILSTEEYSLSGIAYYIDTPEDSILEIISGRNTNPTLFLSTKIIELHRSVRPELYRQILRKILQKQIDSSDGIDN